MARFWGLLGLAVVATTLVAPPAAVQAAPLVYEYRVKHPTYGDIGTYVNVIERSGDTMQVTTTVHVRVKVFGAVIYREDADRTERWQGGRLVQFHGTTTKNGKRSDVNGEARGASFVITGPEGVFIAPANVQPPNPLSSDCLKSDVMMSAATGRLYTAQIIDGGDEVVTLNGRPYQTHKYEIDTDRPHIVWFDERGVPLMLQSVEHGGTVRLMLSNYPPETIHLAEAPPR